MDQDLERYLNDHLAGSSGAVHLIQELGDRYEEEGEGEFFKELRSAVEKDQQTLKELLEKAGLGVSTTLQVMGSISERASRMKLLWEGLEPGKLGMFEALEMLALGIQGKRQLWTMLGELANFFPEWEEYDFAELELAAIRQRDRVEEYRIEAGNAALVSEKRRADWAQVTLKG